MNVSAFLLFDPLLSQSGLFLEQSLDRKYQLDLRFYALLQHYKFK